MWPNPASNNTPSCSATPATWPIITMPVLRYAMGESRMQRKLPVRFGGGWAETDGRIPHGAALPPYATRLMEQGTPDEIRDAIMGHGKKGIRGHYAHATIQAMRAALKQYEQRLWAQAA